MTDNEEELQKLDYEIKIIGKQIELQKQKNNLREITKDKGEGEAILREILQVIENPVVLIFSIVTFALGIAIGHSLG